MIWFQTLFFLLCLGALFAYLNERFLRLETTVGVMVIAMIVSCVGYVLDQFGVMSLHTVFVEFWARFDFSSVLLKGLLCFSLVRWCASYSHQEPGERQVDDPRPGRARQAHLNIRSRNSWLRPIGPYRY